MAHTSSKNKPSRLIHIELLRLLAIFLVIFNHTGDRGFFLFAERMESPLYMLYMIASIACKIAVPIFFMISGALLLSKEETFKQLFCKRIMRMIIVLVLISVPYYLWLHRSQGMRVENFLAYIYGNSATTALWYLYSYIGLLLMMPFLRRMVKNMQAQDFMYLLLGYIIFVGVLPCFEYYMWKGNVTLHDSFSAALFTTSNIFYALMGYYLEHILMQKCYMVRNVWLTVMLSIVALGITCWITNYQIKTTGVCDSAQSQTFYECFICIPAMTVYFLTKYALMSVRSQKFNAWISELGNAVFGVYLVEKFMRRLTEYIFTVIVPYVGSFVASLIWSFASMVCGLVLIVVVKRIPGIRNLINKFI